MKTIMLCFGMLTFLLSCNNTADKPAAATTDATSDSTATSTVDLPYKASYSSTFSTGVSDADLKTVLVSYKDWADGNIVNVAKAYSDTLEWDRPTGDHYKLPNAEIMKMWTTYR